jgi:hypothetical protein
MDEPESFEDLLRPDEMALRFTPLGLSTGGLVMSPEGKLRHLKEEIASAELVPDVPDEVRQHFARLRKLYLYGLLEYDLFTLGSTEAPAANRGHRSSRHTAVRSAEVSHFDTPKYRFSTHRSFWIGSVFNSARHSDRPTFAHVPPYALTGSGCGLCSSLRTSSRCAPSAAAITSIVVRVGLPSPRS